MNRNKERHFVAVFTKIADLPLGRVPIKIKTVRAITSDGNVFERRGSDRYRWIGRIDLKEMKTVCEQWRSQGYTEVGPERSPPSLA